MISVDLARRLSAAGLRWHPAAGDRFVIERGDFDTVEVFTVSDMTVEAHEYPTGTVLGFNGTTEWALDSVRVDETLWLPREDQLRELLGRSFVSLTREARPDGDADDSPGAPTEAVVFEVRTRVPGTAVEASVQNHAARAPDDAYALALLAYIESSLRLD